MGDMQGKMLSEWKGPLPANMETAADLAARADRWWKSTVLRDVGSSRTQATTALNLASEEPVRLLVVSHGGLIRVLLQGLIGSRKIVCGEGVVLDQHFRCANASVSVIELDDASKGRGRLVLLADTTHLDVELVDINVDIVEDDEQQQASTGLRN